MINLKLFQRRWLDIVGKTPRVELALDLRTHYNTICNWDEGKTLPNSYKLVRIAKRFGVSTDWLLGLSDKKERS